MKIKIKTKIVPIKPNSSPINVNIKSVCFSGRNLDMIEFLVKNLFPAKPPEPKAIFD